MQLFKPFSIDENSPFAQKHLRQQTPLNPHSQQKQQESLVDADRSIRNDDKKIDEINYSQFYQEYKKIYTVSYHLFVEKKRLAQINQQLNRQINLISERLRNSSQKECKKIEQSSQENRTKRSRRTAEMIEKRFRCNFQFCQRLYGSEGSLQQHIKLKHPQLYHPTHLCSQEQNSSC